MQDATLILVAAGIGGLAPLGLLLNRLAHEPSKAARKELVSNPWIWPWNLALLPGAAVVYAFFHDRTGNLDVAAAFELGIGIPVVLAQVFARVQTGRKDPDQ